MTRQSETYYIGSVRCHQVKAFNGTVMTSEGKLVWISEEAGYPSNTPDKTDAKRFKSIAAVRTAAQRSDGMPWYYRYIEGSLQIFKVQRVLVENINEYEVTNDA